MLAESNGMVVLAESVGECGGIALLVNVGEWLCLQKVYLNG